MPESVVLDCSELNDTELGDLSNFLESQTSVASFSLKEVSWEDADPDAPLSLQASAAPLLCVLHFIKGHLISTTAETYVAKKAFDETCSFIKNWSKNRAEQFECTKILGPDGEVVSLVKVRKRS